MSNLDIGIPFLIGRDEALRRLKNLLPQIQAEHASDLMDFEEEWDGYSCKFSFRGLGMKITGALLVSENAVNLSASIPFPASLATGKIERVIREKASQVLK